MGIQTQFPLGQSLVLALSDPHSPLISLGNQTGQNLNTLCDQMNHPNSKISSRVTIFATRICGNERGAVKAYRPET